MMKLLNIIMITVLYTSCIKTAEQVQREKRLENMTEQMKDSQGLMADVITQMKDMQSQLDRMNGKIEELEHQQKQISPDSFKQMSETISLVKTQQETEATQLSQIQNELKEQRAFIEKVTLSLSQNNKSDSKSQKKSIKEDLTTALDLVKQNMYGEARAELESLLNHPELSPGDRNKIFHGLGRVEYFTKHYEKALVYFSKIYTKYPKSSLAPNSLLFIGKSLSALDKKDESIEAFKKVTEDYPGTKDANEAKKLL